MVLRQRPAPEPAAVALQAALPAGPQLADWNLLRSFIAIYEAGTLTGAARRLATTQPSLGRHLRELERLLGETLFVRLPGRLRPNARADALFESLAPMQLAAREAARLFTESPRQVAGVVRVAVSEAYAYHVVPAILAPLLAEHPELEIELAVSNRSENLLRREADIAVRHFRPDQPDLVVRKLGETEMGLFAHEDYLARHGEPADLALPPGAVLAGFDREPVALGPYLRGAPPEAPPRFRWRSDSVHSLHAAVECGAAVGMYFVDIAATRPGLRRVLADRIGMTQALWLCAHDELHRSRRTRLVWDCLGDALAARLAGPPAR